MSNRTREKALLDLRIDTEKGIATSFGERVLIMPAKFLHSIEDQLFKTLGPIPAANFLYEMGREAGKRSAWLVLFTILSATALVMLALEVSNCENIDFRYKDTLDEG